MQIFSPGKLNLFFRVLHKREDGFHEIASLYQAIDLGDYLDVRLESCDELTCSDPKIPCDETNLVQKALHLFRRKTGFQDFHVRCHITKKIPIQTGVGGGSSNASTMLYACNELAGKPATAEDLALWGAEIGSDVPFFFSSGSAYCTGRGEIFRNIDYPLQKIFQGKWWLAKPEFGLSTPEVYKACRSQELKFRDPISVLEGFQRGEPEWFNDLEAAASTISPAFTPFKEQLKNYGFQEVVLTGSGSGFFCFGTMEKPSLPNVCFFPIRPLVRNSGEWYSSI